MAALSVLRGYVRDELGELTAGQWSDAQINAWLNRGVDYVVGEFHRGKCWPLLRPITKYAEMTVSTSYQEYTTYDVIANWCNTSRGNANINSWYGYVHGMLGDYVLHEATIEEYNRLNATTGEHAPTTTEPWIVWTGIDRTTKRLPYTQGTEQPEMDGYILGETSEAHARIAIDIAPTSGTFVGTDAAGFFYLYDITGTFQSEQVTYWGPQETAENDAFCSASADASAESHANCPTFKIYPALTTSATLKLFWLNKPDAMSAATDTPDITYDCDNLIVWWATAQAWQAGRNFDMSDRLNAKFQQELQKKIADYTQVTFKSL